MSTRGVATGLELAWAARVWTQLSPHDRVGWYFMTTGHFDPDQGRALNDWYAIDAAARREITNTLVRMHGYFNRKIP